VVFSDLGMPDVNGWDVARRVKAQVPQTPVVLVTGWGSQLEEGTAQARGVDLIMAKPFTIEDVDRALRHVAKMIARHSAPPGEAAQPGAQHRATRDR
jgi:CheY-like chemotaxis protein